MISINFPDCLILEARTGTSKNGAPFANLKFLENSALDVYEFLCFGDAVALVAGLAKGAHVSLEFSLRPNQGRESNLGVRMDLIGVGRS